MEEELHKRIIGQHDAIVGAQTKLLALAVQFLRAKCRAQHDVRHQIESRGQVFFHDIEADVRGILARRSLQRAADEINRLGDVLRRAFFGSLRQQVSGHLRHAWHVPGVLDAARG